MGAELGDPVVVGPCTGQLEVPVVKRGDGVPEPGRGVQDLGLDAVASCARALGRVVQPRQHVGEPKRLLLLVVQVEATGTPTRCGRDGQRDGIAPVDHPGGAAVQRPSSGARPRSCPGRRSNRSGGSRMCESAEIKL